MKQTLSILYILLQCYCAQAQNGAFRIGIGYQRTWVLDQQASPLKYQTSEKTFLVGYEHTGPHAKIAAGLEGGWGSLFPTGFRNRLLYDPGYHPDGTPKNDSFPIPGTFYNARLKLGYLRSLGNGYSLLGKNKVNTGDYLGGSLNNQLFYTDNIVRNGWLNSTSLNADFEHTVLFNNKHMVGIKVSIPLVARNSRLPYHNTISSASGESNIKTFFRQGSRMAWLGNFQHIQVEATYEYAIGKRLGIGAHYTGQWLHYSYEKPVTFVQNNIGLFAAVR